MDKKTRIPIIIGLVSVTSLSALIEITGWLLLSEFLKDQNKLIPAAIVIAVMVLLPANLIYFSFRRDRNQWK